MKCVVLLSVLLLGAAARGEDRASPSLKLQAAQPARASFNLDSAFDSIIHAARIGISSGKIVLLRRGADGRHEEVAVAVGRARMTPLFDLGFSSASALVRWQF